MKKEQIAVMEYGAARNGATISLLPDLNTILLEWRGDVLIEEFIEILSRGLQEIEERKITNWIADASNAGATSDEHSQWVQEVWVPRAIQAGLKKLLTILPKDILGEMTVQEMTENIREVATQNNIDLEFYYTNSFEDAINWINA